MDGLRFNRAACIYSLPLKRKERERSEGRQVGKMHVLIAEHEEEEEEEEEDGGERCIFRAGFK